MRGLSFITALCIAGLGLGMSIYSWYMAHAMGRIVVGVAYAGGFLLIVGIWRVIAFASGMRPPFIFRIIAIGLGLAVGYGSVSALKAVYPSDQIIETTTHG